MLFHLASTSFFPLESSSRSISISGSLPMGDNPGSGGTSPLTERRFKSDTRILWVSLLTVKSRNCLAASGFAHPFTMAVPSGRAVVPSWG